MRSLIYYEFQKIFRRKFNIAVMLAGYVLMLGCAVFFVTRESFYDADSDSYVYGIQGYRMSGIRYGKLTDYLTEEYLTDVVESIQEKNMDLQTDEAYMQVIRPISSLLVVICRNYTDIGEDVEWGILSEISAENGIRFYERRMEKVEEYLNRDFSFGSYSEREKAFWLEKENEVQIPFQWGDKSVINSVWNAIEISFYLMFVVTVCISPVFASEYESGASALLFTTRYGKSKLITAKILAAIMFSLAYVAVGIAMNVAIIGITLGFSGAELPVQLWDTVIPYNWTIGKTCVISFAMKLLITLTFSLFIMLLSSGIKRSLSTLVIAFTVLIGPVFLPMSAESGLWNHINYLFPIRVLMTKEMISTLNSYQFGPVIFSYLGMAVLVYLIAAVISFFGIRYQVNDARFKKNRQMK